MSKIFKTTLVAAAIAGMASVANAGVLTGSATDYSAQGAATAAATATTAVTFSHEVEAGFAVNDLITYSVNAGSVDSAGFNWQSTINFAAGAGGADMTATLLSTSADESTATYRVTSVTGAVNTTTIEATATGIAVDLLNNALVADISVSVSSVLANGVTPIDEGTKAAVLIDSVDQLGNIMVASTSSLNATISVAEARKAFTASETSDTFTWTAANDTTLMDAVAVTKSVVTLNGDFDGFVKGNFTSAGTAAVAEDSQSVTFTYGAAVTTDTITITPPVTSTSAETTAVVLEAQDFEVSSVATFGTSSESLGSADAGEWDLDGAVVTVPYMPYGDTITQIMYVSNAGMLDADISVSGFDSAGNDYDLGIIGQAAGGKVTTIAGAVKTALEAAGFAGGKVSLTITVNAEDKDVSIYAAYNVGGSDRGTVNNSQYKK